MSVVEVGRPVNGAWWLAVRALVSVLAFGAAFVDGLGFFLSPGQAVVWAVASAVPEHAPDPRVGIFLGLVFYAAMAFVSVIMRARSESPEPELATVGAHEQDLDIAA
jgi:hypothetical protein